MKKHYLSGPLTSRLLSHVVRAVQVPLHAIGNEQFYTVLLTCTVTHGYQSTRRGLGLCLGLVRSNMTSADDWFFQCETYFITHYLMESLSWLLWHCWVITEAVKNLWLTGLPFRKIPESNSSCSLRFQLSTFLWPNMHTLLIIFRLGFISSHKTSVTSWSCLYLQSILLFLTGKKNSQCFSERFWVYFLK